MTGQAAMAEPKTVMVSDVVPTTPKRLTGPNASVWKYDLLTALSVFALSQSTTVQTTVLRLIAAITARYDWRRDELSIGREELMRLWQCSEPTVKREVRRMRESGLLITLRPGVRGRVAAYRLCREAITRLTSNHWKCAGKEFAERMGEPTASTNNTNVVAFPPQTDTDTSVELPLWAQVIAAEDAVIYRNWFARVTALLDADTVVFLTPSDFIARQIETRFMRQMQEAARYAWPSSSGIRVSVQNTVLS